MNKHFNIKIYGRVQGVFFRVTAREQAHNLSIKGFAKNESDGTVYIEAEGEGKNLKKFLSWCKVGPDGAKVEKIKISEGLFKNFAEFERDFIDY
ncbi:MAG: acylphosphatase [Candidatus Daviesbacteria bacterium]|nr:acylphosphatase [Candidatus Daviesbacteria bacterium]